ncbi:uroporphyrinogen-III C-methyltransferase [Comamonas koreensis]|uniref:uroporphyrinogen-III C-methyltransferase n=1 Tax=Comamonas koreensis TaxID=160825 RepID=A0AAW4XX97_9BURK|nr:uroporphyrinogen-III C-methyltransferase [Comamonas koreensis]MCD2165663.1 uroporphyrinogen-III C-methyltransferase [Comamonas koreensis]
MTDSSLPTLTARPPADAPLPGLGQCTLVGAGPGDPDLLTIAAAKALQRATVLLVDDLVNEAVLQWAPESARIVHVGKRGGCQSTPQAFIQRLMLQEVQAGENVVRLKGGDPFIFGRGGEEVEFLRAHGIEPRIINGVTAGLAALTSLGAPLTHRDHARGVVFITGHAKPGSQGPDWAQLARTAHDARLTLVIYMGVASAEAISQGLGSGLPADTPVAIVQHASLPQQRHAITDLAHLPATMAREKLASPSIIVVGDVVQCVALAAQAIRNNEPIASRDFSEICGYDSQATVEDQASIA